MTTGGKNLVNLFDCQSINQSINHRSFFLSLFDWKQAT